jgi:hypothetical protein
LTGGQESQSPVFALGIDPPGLPIRLPTQRPIRKGKGRGSEFAIPE